MTRPRHPRDHPETRVDAVCLEPSVHVNHTAPRLVVVRDAVYVRPAVGVDVEERHAKCHRRRQQRPAASRTAVRQAALRRGSRELTSDRDLTAV